MQFAETPTQALTYALRAIEEMRDRNIVPNPNNFSVWYTYVSDRVPDLNKQIETLELSGAPFDDTICAELYDRFLSFATQEAAVAETSNKLSERMTSAIENIRAASADTENFGNDLDGALSRLETIDGVDDLRDTIVAAKTSTLTMAEKNRELETELSGITDEIDQLRSDLETLRHEAYTDGLTGIANRKKFDMALHHETTLAQETGDPVSLMMLDIDFFKKFNDTYGHAVGDQVLRLLAHTMVENVKGQDVPARFGGEEFAIILPNTNLANAVTLAEQVRRAIGTKTLRNRSSGDDLGKITISIGVSTYRSGEPLTDFLNRADAALYTAKNAGRDRVSSEADDGASDLAVKSA